MCALHARGVCEAHTHTREARVSLPVRSTRSHARSSCLIISARCARAPCARSTTLSQALRACLFISARCARTACASHKPQARSTLYLVSWALSAHFMWWYEGIVTKQKTPNSFVTLNTNYNMELFLNHNNTPKILLWNISHSACFTHTPREARVLIEI